MRSDRFPLIVVAASALALLVLAVVSPFEYPVWSWSPVVSVYVLTLVLVGGAWHWLDRPLGFPELTAVAAVSMAGLAVPSLVGSSGSIGAPLWVDASDSLQRLLPTVLMLPLGAAVARRQRIGVVAAMLGIVAAMAVPAIVDLFYWFVLYPENPTLVTVWRAGYKFAFFVAAGGPLFALGHDVVRGDGPLLDATRRLSAPGTG